MSRGLKARYEREWRAHILFGRLSKQGVSRDDINEIAEMCGLPPWPWLPESMRRAFGVGERKGEVVRIARQAVELQLSERDQARALAELRGLAPTDAIIDGLRSTIRGWKRHNSVYQSILENWRPRVGGNSSES